MGFVPCFFVQKEADGGETEAELALFGEYMAINRVRKLMRAINFPNLLVFLVGQSFKKVSQCILVLQVLQTNHSLVNF